MRSQEVAKAIKVHSDLVTLNLVSRQSIQSRLNEVCKIVLLLEDSNLPCGYQSGIVRRVEC